MASFKQWLEAQRNSDGSMTNPTGVANQAVDIAQNAMARPQFTKDISAIQAVSGNPSVQTKLLTKLASKATRAFPGHPGDLQASPIDVGRAFGGEMRLKLPAFPPLQALRMRKRMKRQ